MAVIRPLRREDLAGLRGLFRGFPYKEYQRRFQDLDAGKLTDLFWSAEKRRLEKAEATGADGKTGQWVGVEKDEVTAFAGLREDAWHSDAYPFRFGRVAPFLAYRASAECRSALLDVLLEEARGEGFEHSIVRIDGAEYDTLQMMEKKGFYLVDSSGKFSATLQNIPDLAAPSRAGSTRIRPWEMDDLEEIRRIAASSHPMNHYYNDPFLKRGDSDRLFERWVERCCVELDSEVFVLDRRGRVEGFVVYLNPKGMNEALGTRLVILDFVCLADRARGGGLGRWLIGESLRRLAGKYELMELRTSHHNYLAVSCYQSLNMKLISTDFILHRHE